MTKLKNILWYTRDGHLDFFARLSQRLQAAKTDIASFYVCHTIREEKLLDKYGITPSVLGTYIANRKKTFTYTDQTIRYYEQEYGSIPLRRLAWGEMYEKNFSETTIIFHLIAHIEFWEKYLLENKITGVVSERPGLLSTNVLWMLCEKHHIKFIDFLTVAIDNRIFLTSSWNGDVDLFESKFKTIEIDRESQAFSNSVDYLEKMIARPEKPAYLSKNLVTGEIVGGGNIYSGFNIKNVLSIKKMLRFKENTSYYINTTASQYLASTIAHKLGTQFHKLLNIFEKVPFPRDERFFLFPLHVHGEWVAYSYLGLKYPNYLAVLNEISSCLPLGYKLYVKAHSSGFPDKSLHVYQAIKKIPRVRLIHPQEDCFALIRNSEGIITLGGSMGWEAFLLSKPVVIMGEPWYKKLPGIFKSDSPEQLTELLQNIHKMPLASNDDKLKAIYTLYQLGFEGIRYPIPELIDNNNIEKYLQPFKSWIED